MSPMESQSRPHVLQRKLADLKALWHLFKELISLLPTPSIWWKMNYDWRVHTSWRYNWSLLFPTTSPSPLAELPASWQDRTQTLPGGKKSNLYFGEQFAAWRMLPAAAYKSLLTSEDTSGMISGTSLPPHHFSSLNSNRRRTPLQRARVHGASRKTVGRRTR